MNIYPPDPLTPEERELAQLTSRLGPFGEPSPALDARILAAAHASVARTSTRKPKPRWPVAMGLAASVVFAVGIAWQLRPVQRLATVAQVPEAAAPAPAEQSAAASAEAVAEEAAPERVADTGAVADASAMDMAAGASAPQASIAPPGNYKPQEQAPARAQRRSAPVYVPSAPPEAPPVLRESRAGDGYSPQAAIAPPAPPAPVMSAPPMEEAPQAFASDSAAADQPTLGAYARTNSARSAAAKQAVVQGELKASVATRAKEADTLDRVEVTGSRINRTDLQVPVSSDAQLAVEEWLERVRTRYGLGDAGAAKQSLLLFVKDHPGEPIPDDLEPLLDE